MSCHFALMFLEEALHIGPAVISIVTKGSQITNLVGMIVLDSQIIYAVHARVADQLGDREVAIVAAD